MTLGGGIGITYVGLPALEFENRFFGVDVLPGDFFFFGALEFVRTHVLDTRHAYQRRGNSRRGAHELQRSFRVAVQPERFRHKGWQSTGHLPLQQ